MSIKFNKLAYDSVDDFVYGSCKKPVTTKSGLIIGGGEVYPELNFTLPSMIVLIGVYNFLWLLPMF